MNYQNGRYYLNGVHLYTYAYLSVFLNNNGNKYCNRNTSAYFWVKFREQKQKFYETSFMLYVWYLLLFICVLRVWGFKCFQGCALEWKSMQKSCPKIACRNQWKNIKKLVKNWAKINPKSVKKPKSKNWREN